MSSSAALRDPVTIVCQADFFRNNLAVSTFLASIRSEACRIIFTHCVHGDAVYKAMVADLESSGWNKENILFAPVDESYKARPDLVRDSLLQSSFEVQVSGLHVIKKDIDAHFPKALIVAGDRSYLLRVAKFLNHVFDDEDDALPHMCALPPADAVVGGEAFYSSIGMLYDDVLIFGAEFHAAVGKYTSPSPVKAVPLPFSLPSKAWGSGGDKRAAREKHLPADVPEDAFVFGCLSAPVPESRLDHAVELFLVACVSVEKAFMVLSTHGAGRTTEAYADLADLVRTKAAAASQSIVASRYRQQREEKGDDFQPPEQKEVDEQLAGVQRELLSRFCIVTKTLTREGMTELASACDLGVCCAPAPTYDGGSIAFARAGVPALLPASPYYRNMFGAGAWFDKVSLPTREVSWTESKGGKPSHDSAIITFQAVPSVEEHGDIVRAGRIPEIKNAFNIVVDGDIPAYEDLAEEIDTAEGAAVEATFETPQKATVLSSGFVISHQVKTYAEALALAEKKIKEAGSANAVQIAVQCKEDAGFVYEEVRRNAAHAALVSPLPYATTRVLDPAFSVILHTQHVVRAFELDLQKSAPLVANMCKASAEERRHLGRLERELADAVCDDATAARDIFLRHLTYPAEEIDVQAFPVVKLCASTPPAAPVAQPSNSTRLLPGTRVEEEGKEEEALPALAPIEEEGGEEDKKEQTEEDKKAARRRKMAGVV